MTESFPMTAAEEAETECWIDEIASARASVAHLRLAVLALSICLVALAGLASWAFLEGRRVETVLVRLDESGRAEPVGSAAEYRPRAAELKHFLARFTALHYSRLRTSAAEDFARSLLFLDARLARAARATAEESGEIERCLVGAEPEVDIRIRGVRIPDMRAEPFRAVVDFEKIRSRGDYPSFIGRICRVTSDVAVRRSNPIRSIETSPVSRRCSRSLWRRERSRAIRWFDSRSCPFRKRPFA